MLVNDRKIEAPGKYGIHYSAGKSDKDQFLLTHAGIQLVRNSFTQPFIYSVLSTGIDIK